MIDGSVALQGGDPIALPFDRFLNLVYAWVTERLDEQARRRFDVMIDRPLPGEEPRTGPWSDEAMESAFTSFSREFDG